MSEPRMLAPVLNMQFPPCSVCGMKAEFRSGRYRCDNCRLSWGRDGYGATWDDPNAEQCRHMIFDKATQTPRRCLLEEDHDPTLLHADGNGWWE